MIWYILFALAVLGTAFAVWNDTGDFVDVAIMGVVIPTIIFGMIFFFIGGAFSTYGPLHREEGGVYQLVAINDDSKISGSTFLFSGYLDESQVYNFYTKEGTNIYQRSYQYAKDSLIIEDQPKGQAYLKQYYLVPNQWIGFTWAKHLRNEFHVPPGSVQQEVVLDNQ